MKNHAKVEFFDIFIFNNVKSDLEIILYQSNKVVFKVKVLWRSLIFPWQAPEVLTKDGAYTIQEERDVRNAMQLCSESFDL